MPKQLPAEFEVPEALATERVKIRPLAVSDAEKDYDAIMSNAEFLRNNPCLPCFAGWPAIGMTLKENTEDLRWHEKKHKAREEFTFTVMTPDETKCIGCVYVLPPEEKGFDADVYFWVTLEESRKGLEKYLLSLLKEWFKESWRFKNERFPGREMQ